MPQGLLARLRGGTKGWAQASCGRATSTRWRSYLRAAKWEYGVRDLTSNIGFAPPGPNHWPVHTGGNFAWWGAEVNDWQSVLGNRVVDPSCAMNTMEWEESDNGKWNQISASTCSGLTGPWYYGCGTDNRTTLEGWTDDR